MASQSLLAIPPKTTKSVDLVPAITRFIGNNYDDQPSKYVSALSELQTLREATVVKTPDKHDTGLDLICRYYDQLCAMESKLPIAEDKINIRVTWYDAFQKGGLFSDKKTAQVSAIYERCCVLFNIGSLQSQIAKFQNFESDEGLKNAIKYFQGAAGSFQLLQELVFAHLKAPPSADFSAESTTALKSLMLAQAQESFCIKASKDLKDPVIARIAMQASDLYADAYNTMLVGSVKNQWEKGWLSIVTAKQAYFHAVAQHRLGLVAKANKNFGEAVARLKKATELLQESERKGEGMFKSYELTSNLKKDFESTQKDNNFIYNDRIPDFATLEPPGKAVLAKPIQFTSPASNFSDLFGALMPLAVNQAKAVYTGKKDSIVSLELDKLRDATQILNAMLADRNLPAAIEETSGQGLPDSIKEKAEGVQAGGGVASIDQKIGNLPDMVTNNKEILGEAQRVLEEEEREDGALKDRFKEKWTRQPSRSLNESIRKELEKFRTILDNATRADETIKTKFNTHRNYIAMLSKPVVEIEGLLPKAGASSNSLKGCKSVLVLRGLMEQVTQLKEAREVLEKRLNDPVTDIVPKFMEALKLGDLDSEAISDAHLTLAYGGLQQEVASSLENQKALVTSVESAHQQFMAETKGQFTSPREEELKKLAAAYDAFTELQNNVTEGTKFYENLTHLLSKLQDKVKDFVFARNTEKDDLIKELQRTIASQPSSAPSSVPQYHGSEQPKPPARPPPPMAQSSSPRPQLQGANLPPPAQPYYSGAPPPSQGPPPQQPYYSGAPPPGTYTGYGAPPYGYNQPPPPQGGYNQPPPPQGGYNQPPPPQGGYNVPPPHQYYPGAPPPPGGYPGYPQPGYPPYGYPPGQPYQPPSQR
ncbi:hypothetical protein EMCRGX_G004061 [Ephydatia muelleri]